MLQAEPHKISDRGQRALNIGSQGQGRKSLFPFVVLTDYFKKFFLNMFVDFRERERKGVEEREKETLILCLPYAP